MSEPREPLCTWSEPLREEWIDYNGHLSEAYYVLVLGHATDAAMEALGMGPAYRERTGASLYTVEAHVRYLDQVGPGELLEVRTWAIGGSRKLLRLWHELWAGGSLRATEEVLGLHVDSGRVSGRAASAPFPDDVAALVEAALTEPGPEAGRAIRL